MPVTETVGQESKNIAAVAPAWVSELTRNQKRDIKSCLPFLFKPLEDACCGWAWPARLSNMTAFVKFGEEKNTLIIAVLDGDAREEIDLWRTEVRLTGLWKRRLRQFTGEALVLCQYRPRCPKCGSPVLLVRRRDDRVQFFGCSQFRSSSNCTGSLNIIDHDVERPS